MRLTPHPLSLRQLQYAVAVDDARSFRRAAERCRVAQPSLSAQIAQLEAGLGVRLFERDRRRVMPTQAGQEILDRARRLLVDADDLVETARRRHDPLTRTLRIGVIPTIAPYLLPESARALRAAYPQLSVVWVEDKTAALVARLAEGSLDATIAALPLSAQPGDIDYEEIAKDEFVLAAPSGHPLAHARGPARPEELRGQHVLLLDDGHCLRDQALALCSAANAQEVGFRATSLPTLVQMVAGGAGITLLPTLALPLELTRADLHIRPFAEPVPRRDLALAWRRRSYLDAALRRVAATIRSACRNAGKPSAPIRSAPAPFERRAAEVRARRTSAKR
jgi:LysR family hydrogen peroxide-inducible transcriptional activator